MRAVELLAELQREEVDVGFSFGVPNGKTIVQEAVWTYPLVLLPSDHELAKRDVLAVSALLSFAVITCHLDRLPGLRQHMDVVREHYMRGPVFAEEARPLVGCVTRVAARLGVGVVDVGHMRALCCNDVVVVPLAEDIRFTTYELHKHQRRGLPGALQRFPAHAKTPH